jgi:hypothetical protein
LQASSVYANVLLNSHPLIGNEMTTLDLQIDYDIPLPVHGRRPGGMSDVLRALAQAKVGASIAHPGPVESLRGVANRIGGSGWVAIRKEGSGFRLWKIAEPPKAVS